MADRKNPVLRSLLAGTFILGLTGAALAQTPGNVAREKTLVVAHQTEAPNYRNVGMANPYSINNEDIRGSILNMFEPLFYYNSNKDEIIPWLAESLEFNDDFTQVTVKLRDGVTWSDGQPFTAKDVAFTYEMLRENGGGAKDLVQAGNVATAIAKTEATDPLTVVFTLNAPDPRFALSFLMNYYDIGYQIVPEHIWSGVENKAEFSNFDLAQGWPVTTGPWKLVRFTDSQIFMDRRGDYWGAATGFTDLPAMERILTVPGGTRDRMAQMIGSGQVDITADLQLTSVMKELVARPDVTTFSGKEAPYGSIDWWPTSLYFNHLNPKWGDARLRHAVNYFIDRDQLIEVVYGGASEKLFGPFPAFGALKPYTDVTKTLAEANGIGVFDPAKGDALMQEAGFTKNASGMWEKDGTVLAAQIETIPQLDPVAPVVAEQLRRAGIDAQFRSSPESRAVMRDGRADLMIFGHRGSISDPYATLAMYTCANALPEGQPTMFMARWCNEEYDAAVAKVAALPPGDPGLVDGVSAAMEIWMREAVEVPLTEWYHRVPLNTAHWSNWPSLENPYMQPAFWYTSGQFGYVLHQLEPAAAK